MVMSIGFNPYFKNTTRTAEVHVLHKFSQDFYDAHMRVLILGYIREEKDYDSMDALITDIKTDCDVARNSLRRAAWAPRKGTVVGQDDVDGTLDVDWLVQPL